jgi:hypothetical protein
LSLTDIAEFASNCGRVSVDRDVTRSVDGGVDIEGGLNIKGDSDVEGRVGADVDGAVDVKDGLRIEGESTLRVVAVLNLKHGKRRWSPRSTCSCR